VAAICLTCHARYEDPLLLSCPADGAKLHMVLAHYTTDEKELRGRVIAGRYIIDSLIGVGGSGMVVKAQHAFLERSVAIKLLMPNLIQHADERERFTREAKVLSAVRDPNVVEIVDFGVTAEKLHYLVMEYLVGCDLQRLLLERGALHPVVAARIGVELCAALTAIHTAGVVHRDLKPANCWVLNADKTPASWHMKLLDFGIAGLTDPTASPLTAAGRTLGTPYYMSPEQIRGEKADGRSDLYALGCILWECATGERVFGGGGVDSIFERHLTQQPRPPSEVVPGLPGWYDSAVLLCLRKDRERRPTAANVLTTMLTSGADRMPELGDLGLVGGDDTLSDESAAFWARSGPPSFTSSSDTLRDPSFADTFKDVPSPHNVKTLEALDTRQVSQEALPSIVHTGETRKPKLPKKPPTADVKATALLPPVGEVQKSRLGLWIGLAVLVLALAAAAVVAVPYVMDSAEPAPAPEPEKPAVEPEAVPPPVVEAEPAPRVDVAPEPAPKPEPPAEPLAPPLRTVRDAVPDVLARPRRAPEVNKQGLPSPMMATPDQVIYRSTDFVDPANVDVLSFYDSAREIARKIQPDARLMNFYVSDVRADGLADVSADSTIVGFNFVTKMSGERCYIIVNLFKTMIVADQRKFTCLEAVERPKCTLKAVHARAVALGSPAEENLRVSYGADVEHGTGWSVQDSVGTRQFGDDCKP